MRMTWRVTLAVPGSVPPGATTHDRGADPFQGRDCRCQRTCQPHGLRQYLMWMDDPVDHSATQCRLRLERVAKEHRPGLESTAECPRVGIAVRISSYSPRPERGVRTDDGCVTRQDEIEASTRGRTVHGCNQRFADVMSDETAEPPFRVSGCVDAVPGGQGGQIRTGTEGISRTCEDSDPKVGRVGQCFHCRADRGGDVRVDDVADLGTIEGYHCDRTVPLQERRTTAIPFPRPLHGHSTSPPCLRRWRSADWAALNPLIPWAPAPGGVDAEHR